MNDTQVADARPGETGPITALLMWARTVPVTLSLVLVNLLVFGVINASADFGYGVYLFLRLDTMHFWSGEFWRAVTTGFVHAGWEHVLTNMICLAIVGVRLERMIGSMNMLRAYTICLLGSSGLMLLMRQEAIGASGALFGVIGVLLTCPLTEDARGRKRVAVTWIVLALFFYDQFFGEPDEATSLVAHLGGFLAGLGVGASLSHVQGVPLWSRRDRVLAVLAIAFALCGALSGLEYWGSPGP